MFGKLAVLDPPDVHRAQGEAPPGRGDPLHRLGMRCRECHARDDLVPLNDSILDRRLHVRHAREKRAENLALCGKPVRPGAGWLNLIPPMDLAEPPVSWAFTAATYLSSSTDAI